MTRDDTPNSERWLWWVLGACLGIIIGYAWGMREGRSELNVDLRDNTVLNIGTKK